MKWKNIIWITLNSLLFALTVSSPAISQKKTPDDIKKEMDKFWDDWFSPTFRVQLEVTTEDDFKGEAISYSKEKGKAMAGEYVVFYINQLQRRFPDDEFLSAGFRYSIFWSHRRGNPIAGINN